jgi:ubiquinol-cytochrome c reductase iron-sulfur subunit
MRVLEAVVAWLALRLFGRVLERRHEREESERIVERAEPSPGAELVVAALLVAGGLCAALFVVLYAIDASTQLLGLALGGALALIAAALVVLAKRVAVTEHLTEEYPQPKLEQADEVTQIIRESGDGITRKGLLIAAGGAAGCALGAAAVVPALSLGPLLDRDPLYRTPWRRGLALVDEDNKPVLADDIEQAAFYTAFPAGARKDAFGAPVVLVRLPPGDLRLPAGRRDWAPEGILAFSKICTHAGCAIALYRSPLYDPTEPRPALVCPCHYSTFDPSRGGEVIYGPAGRELPQLPLTIGPGRKLRAAGDFSGPVGPSFSGVRRRRAT